MFFYETLCELGFIEAIEKTLIDVTHYSSYNTYLTALRVNEEYIEDDSLSDSEENAKKAKVKIGCIECLINTLTVVPRNLSFNFRYYKALYYW
jgi:hypothetical protein